MLASRTADGRLAVFLAIAEDHQISIVAWMSVAPAKNPFSKRTGRWLAEHGNRVAGLECPPTRRGAGAVGRAECRIIGAKIAADVAAPHRAERIADARKGGGAGEGKGKGLVEAADVVGGHLAHRRTSRRGWSPPECPRWPEACPGKQAADAGIRGAVAVGQRARQHDRHHVAGDARRAADGVELPIAAPSAVALSVITISSPSRKTISSPSSTSTVIELAPADTLALSGPPP